MIIFDTNVNILERNAPIAFGNTFFHFNESTSTNNVAKQFAADGIAGHGTIIRSDWQSKGRGQETTSWESEPAKNLLCSLIFHPSRLLSQNIVYLNMAVCLSAIDVLSPYTNDAAIKWPNDLYVGNKKIAGILIENTVQGNLIKQVIIGLGFNINQQHFLTTTNAISLSQVANYELDIGMFLKQWLNAISLRYTQFENGDFSQLWNQYHQYLYQLGNTCNFECNGEIIEGTVLGVNTDGLLRLKIDTSEQLFHVKQLKWL